MALTAIHPGEHLVEELKALDMSAAELARKIGVPTNRVTQILNGTRAITGDTALRLAHFLNSKEIIRGKAAVRFYGFHLQGTEPQRQTRGKKFHSVQRCDAQAILLFPQW